MQGFESLVISPLLPLLAQRAQHPKDCWFHLLQVPPAVRELQDASRVFGKCPVQVTTVTTAGTSHYSRSCFGQALASLESRAKGS